MTGLVASVAFKDFLSRVGETATWLFAHPMFAVAAGLAIYGGIERHEAAKWHGVAESDAKVIKAGEKNAEDLKQQKAQTEAKNAAITRKVNDEIPPARKAALAAVDTYAAAHQCVQPSPVATTSGDARPSVPEAADTTPGTAPSGAAAALVAVPKWGADNCTVNTVNAQKWFEWWQAVSQPASGQ